MRHSDMRLVSLAAVFWAAVLATLALGPGATWAIIALASGAVMTGLLVERHLGEGRVRYWAPTLGLLLVGAGCACLATSAHLAAESRGLFPKAVNDEASVVITGRISSYRLGKGMTVRMSVGEISRRGETSAARASVYLTGDVERLSAGQIVRARVRLAPTEGLGRERAWARLTKLIEVRPASGLERWVARRSVHLTKNLAGTPHSALGLVPGLAVGDDSALPEESAEAMRRVSLTHLTAVSGQHVSMVCALVIGAIGLRRRRTAVVAAGLILLALIVTTAAQPSVLRAGVMGGAILVSLWLRRPASALPALGLSVILLLLADPRLAASFGFSLSVLATTGIVLGSRPAAVILAGALPLPVAHLLAVPLVAHLACAPVLALLTKEASLWSAVANAVCAPVVPAATVLSLAALLAAPIPLLGPVLASMAGWLVAWIDLVARAMDDWPGSGLTSIWVVAGYVGLLAGCWLAARLGPRLLLGAALIPLLAHVRNPVVREWNVVQCDVGQGAASLVRADGVTYLIDTGMVDARLPDCLEHAGAQVDVLVLTHLHADHAGRASWVDEEFALTEVWVGPGVGEEAARFVTAPIVELAAGERRGPFEVLWPDGAVSCETDSCQNDQSLVLRADLGETYLITGDLETEAQRSLAARDIAVDVALIPHHGSPRQDPGFARRVNARLALLSVGPNSYGHPSPATIDLYGSYGEVWSTEELGDIFLLLNVEY
ncbi:MAG: ComEC/Rec2 family competence protein [Flaviflexus sp.]|nr:ComEC/Rec2 family competence protein [Flaviflexus sp.]